MPKLSFNHPLSCNRTWASATDYRFSRHAPTGRDALKTSRLCSGSAGDERSTTGTCWRTVDCNVTLATTFTACFPVMDTGIAATKRIPRLMKWLKRAHDSANNPAPHQRLMWRSPLRLILTALTGVRPHAAPCVGKGGGETTNPPSSGGDRAPPWWKSGRTHAPCREGHLSPTLLYEECIIPRLSDIVPFLSACGHIWACFGIGNALADLQRDVLQDRRSSAGTIPETPTPAVLRDIVGCGRFGIKLIISSSAGYISSHDIAAAFKGHICSVSRSQAPPKFGSPLHLIPCDWISLESRRCTLISL